MSTIKFEQMECVQDYMEAYEASTKIAKVHAWIGEQMDAGTDIDARAMVNLFGLDWSLIKELGNGVAHVGFYTDCSLRNQVADMHLPVGDWFRA